MDARKESRDIHLLPPHELLSSHFRTIQSLDGRFHASFAWLGHGAMILKSRASSFIKTLEALGASDVQKQMADNYYTLLSNSIPELWFDHGIELGLGVAFTSGSEGHARNWIHIVCIFSPIIDEMFDELNRG
jgi:hypothetical protein